MLNQTDKYAASSDAFITLGQPAQGSASLPARIAAIAAATPDAIALRAACGTLSYGELETRAAHLAAYLTWSGAKPGMPIPVCLPRSFNQIIALLAVMKTGAAFMPLDAGWPAERLRKLLRDADSPLLIAEPELGAPLAGEDRLLLSPLADAEIITRFDPLPPVEISAEDLAYVIYTSGSTGEPKGVEITHGNLANLIGWHLDAFGVTATDRASHLAGLGFDAAVWEIWPYLSCGASISLAPDIVRTAPELLQRWLLEERLTIAFVPTSLAEPLFTAAWPADTALRLMLIGAERVHGYPPAGLPFRVSNNYGPTECTVVATSCLLAESGEEGLPPIGRPIANCEIHLLDEAGRPVAPGSVGEIHIGGAGVGRGYHERPDLTEKSFIADPFSGRPGARLYRTGDLGCALPDGQIAFRGRVDDQEKIRGHRVEPDEIAAVINRHPAIATSAVVARGSDERDKQLVAYLLPAGEALPSAEELRAWLAAELPDYMVPSCFVRLADLPLTSSGKLDRAALPEPSNENRLASSQHRAPATPLEQRLATIVAEVLGVPSVGADDNFFLLGGHSLLGTQVVLRVRDAFGIRITLLHLFEAPTVAKLAIAVEKLLVEQLAAMSEEEAAKRLAV